MKTNRSCRNSGNRKIWNKILIQHLCLSFTELITPVGVSSVTTFDANSLNLQVSRIPEGIQTNVCKNPICQFQQD